MFPFYLHERKQCSSERECRRVANRYARRLLKSAEFADYASTHSELAREISAYEWTDNNGELDVAACMANVEEPYRAHFFASPYSIFPFHQRFAGARSSEAMCVNLLYPLVVHNRLKMFCRLAGVPKRETRRLIMRDENMGFEWKSDCFPKSAVSERMYFDFFVRFATGSKVYVEVKYADDRFDRLHNRTEKANRMATYLRSLCEANEHLLADAIDEENLYADYQLLRYLVHLDEQSYLVFIYPQARSDLAEKLARVEQYVRPESLARVKIWTLEMLLTELAAEESLREHCERFWARYCDSVRQS